MSAIWKLLFSQRLKDIESLVTQVKWKKDHFGGKLNDVRLDETRDLLLVELAEAFLEKMREVP